MLYLLLAQLEVVPAPEHSGVRPRVAIVLSTMIGLALSALWEMVEWIGFVGFTDEIHVEYEDTIGDMAVGGVGAFCAGLLLARVRLMRADA